MKRLLIALSGGILILLIVSLVVAVYLYVSLTPTSASIVRRAEAVIPIPAMPPKPTGSTVDVETQAEQRACFDFPSASLKGIEMRRACTTIVPATHARKVLDPNDEQMRDWNAQVNARLATRALAIQNEAQRLAEQEKERMRKEIEFWSSIIAGPAPVLVALSGFLATLLLERRRKPAE